VKPLDLDKAIALVEWIAHDHIHLGIECQEQICCICHKIYATWHADNDLWNRTMRLGSGKDLVPFACPRCFLLLAHDETPIARISSSKS
jgi:hypothetical protein